MIKVDITKAKDIAHAKRRAVRSAEFAPLDIKATIPAEADDAEAQRQAIRDKYAVIQTEIDSATDVDVIKSIVVSLEAL